jgi:superfamily II DNA or RNA helicase
MELPFMTSNEAGRRFNGKQRIAMYLAQDGKCAICGIELSPGWHGDHTAPWSQGGETDVINGQALCPTCNLKKGSHGPSMETQLRRWQQEAWDQYWVDWADGKADWLLCATPGAGKTFWSLLLAKRLLDRGTVDRVVIVVPTQTLLVQWINQNKVDLHLTNVQNADGGAEDQRDFQGCVVTYAQVAANADLQRRATGKRRTLVIFDEIHHAGDKQTWGSTLYQAFEHARIRIGVTGTPWRRPGTGNIPFVHYEADGRVHVDYAYEYGDAVKDGVCRPVQFHAFDGEVKYVEIDSCAPHTITRSLGDDEDDHSEVLKELLNPSHPWMHSIIQRADQALVGIRHGDEGEDAILDAKGLVIVENQSYAKEMKKILEKMTGEQVALVISEDPDARETLERFGKGKIGRWAVAVDMFSEGVDVPSLMVGVYATRKKTPLRFRQIVGRFVRRRSNEEQDAIVFMPAVPSLMELAGDIQTELRHIADKEREAYEREHQEDVSQSGVPLPAWVPTDVSPAYLDQVISQGKTYTQSQYQKAVDECHKRNIPERYALNLIDVLGKTVVEPDSSEFPSQEQEDTAQISRDKFKRSLRGQLVARSVSF